MAPNLPHLTTEMLTRGVNLPFEWAEPLTDPKRGQLRRPLDRQIDPIQQGLGA